MTAVLRKIGWVLVAVLALLMFLLASRFFFVDVDATDPTNLFRDLYVNRTVLLYIHLFPIMVAIIVGPVQFFLRRLTPATRRAEYLPLHRWLGRSYITGALIGGVGALPLAFYAVGGFVSTVGFGLLAVLMLITTSIAYLRIRAKNESSHKEWMTRSYALIFAAVTLRLWFPFFQFALGIEEMEAYQATAWMAWVPNLIVAEIINTHRRRTESREMAR